MQRKTMMAAGAALLTLSGAAGDVMASGFGIFTHGASALGQGAAVTAHGDGPSAIYYNPAQLNDVAGTQMEIGTTLIFPDRDFSGGGASAETKDTVFFPSTFYVSHQVNDRVSVGLGVFSPFGLGTDWGESWSGKYLATKSEMETFAVNPVISWRPLPWLALAAGVDVLYLDTTLEKKFNTEPVLGTELPVNQKFSGDGTGIGYNLAAIAKPAERLSVGISYRSPIEVDIKGDLDFTTPSPLFDPYFPDTGGKATITLPQQLSAGVAYAVTERLLVEAGLRWEDWSSFDKLKTELDLLPPDTQQKKWHDTYAVNVGGSYRLNRDVTLMAGYLYGNDPVPDSTFEPSIPDSDSHLFTVGGSYTMDRLRLSMSYGYQLMEKRTKISNEYGDLANGTYDSNLHLVAVSLGYSF